MRVHLLAKNRENKIKSGITSVKKVTTQNCYLNKLTFPVGEAEGLAVTGDLDGDCEGLAVLGCRERTTKSHHISE